jgi:hypothetical protein
MKNNHNNTYNINLCTCEKFGLTINLTAVPYGCMTEIYKKARGAFRDISITNAETGELILQHYESDEIFIATEQVGETMCYIKHILDMANEMGI